MGKNEGKKGFKVIGSTALILKIITILTIIALIIAGIVIWIKYNIEDEEIEKSQVVAEIEYTDDIEELSDLEILQNVFGINIYDENKANDNIISITVLVSLNCLIEFILLILIFDGVQKLFINLYKTDDGLITDKNAKIVKNIGIFAILRLIIPFVLNIITHYMLSSTIRGKITVFQIVFTLIIVITAFATYYKIRLEQKNVN